MNTAVDSSVLFAIFNEEDGWEAWNELLRTALSEGQLLACPVVFAEIAMGFPSDIICRQALLSLGIEFSSFSPYSAWLAGKTYANYRRRGGPRTHMIPDFLIAAHAATEAGRLAAIDRGYIRPFFTNLEVLRP